MPAVPCPPGVFVKKGEASLFERRMKSIKNVDEDRRREQRKEGEGFLCGIILDPF